MSRKETEKRMYVLTDEMIIFHDVDMITEASLGFQKECQEHNASIIEDKVNYDSDVLYELHTNELK